ncbi:MAG TPA: UV DNA damage repair endonuclease UvsE [Gemmatimonadales bacterium]|nr:UV DNA damage repair endonuclease UvsE [Gemmatimonadales bacterium]
MGSIRWGLCCQFLDAPIRFRAATATYVLRLPPRERWEYLREIAQDNAESLTRAIAQCHALGIGAFRITSQILPLATHPKAGYTLPTLDPTGTIRKAFRAAGKHAKAAGIRLSFHPDQFVVVNSERPSVVDGSLQELEFQAEVAALVGADVIVIHGGGKAGGMEASLTRLEAGLRRLSRRARGRLALENDDRSFTPSDLLPLCNRLQIPLVYDVHHHRCLPDGLSVAEATRRALATWGSREPHFHLSSPRSGWNRGDPRPHAEYLDPRDVPREWRSLALTVDVEAKAKERAVVAIARHTDSRPRKSRS